MSKQKRKPARRTGASRPRPNSGPRALRIGDLARVLVISRDESSTRYAVAKRLFASWQFVAWAQPAARLPPSEATNANIATDADQPGQPGPINQPTQFDDFGPFGEFSQCNDVGAFGEPGSFGDLDCGAIDPNGPGLFMAMVSEFEFHPELATWDSDSPAQRYLKSTRSAPPGARHVVMDKQGNVLPDDFYDDDCEICRALRAA